MQFHLDKFLEHIVEIAKSSLRCSNPTIDERCVAEQPLRAQVFYSLCNCAKSGAGTRLKVCGRESASRAKCVKQILDSDFVGWNRRRLGGIPRDKAIGLWLQRGAQVVIGLAMFTCAQWLRPIGEADFAMRACANTEVVAELPIIEIMPRLQRTAAGVGRDLVLLKISRCQQGVARVLHAG